MPHEDHSALLVSMAIKVVTCCVWSSRTCIFTRHCVSEIHRALWLWLLPRRCIVALTSQCYAPRFCSCGSFAFRGLDILRCEYTAVRCRLDECWLFPVSWPRMHLGECSVRWLRGYMAQFSQMCVLGVTRRCYIVSRVAAETATSAVASAY